MPNIQPTTFSIVNKQTGGTVAFAALFPDGSVAVMRNVPPTGTLHEWWDTLDACRLLYETQNGFTFRLPRPAPLTIAPTLPAPQPAHHN